MLRNEYPRPSFKRDNYQTLNGKWKFDFNDDNRYTIVNNNINKKLSKEIVVPFAYQCKASGIGDLSRHENLIYQKNFDLEKNLYNKSILLCFNSVDYECDVYLNGTYLGKHIGYGLPFEFDVTNVVKEKDNSLIVKVIDKYDPTQPRGKQYYDGNESRCWYNSDSGIIGSVWLESFNKDYLNEVLITTDIDTNMVNFLIKTKYQIAKNVKINISYKNELVKSCLVSLDKYETNITLKIIEDDYIDEEHYWSVENPSLYDVEITLCDEMIFDHVITYFGFRKIHKDEKGNIYLNNRLLYQRLVLDQGYFIDGDLTCLDINDLKNDIILAKKMGFNGARKHQKIEDPYYYYYADKLGFLVWSELPSAYRFSNEEIYSTADLVQKNTINLYNHPSIITWVIFNESWGIRKALTDNKTKDFVRSMYYLVKSIDQTRLVNSNDGWEQVEQTDIIALHDYDPYINNYEKYNIENIDILQPMFRKAISYNEKYSNQPIILTEYGGLSCKDDVNDKFYGYHVNNNKEALIENFKILQANVYKCPFVGFCYTQLTDVKQETNGLLYQNRKAKFELEEIRKIIENEK